jgi:hypothetical protein
MYGDYIRRGLDWQLDLLDHTQLQLQCVTVYTLYNTTQGWQWLLSLCSTATNSAEDLQGPGPPADPLTLAGSSPKTATAPSSVLTSQLET